MRLLPFLLLGALAAAVTHATPAPRLINLSCRVQVGTNERILIGGFVIADAPKTVLIRGIGPTLADYQVPGVLNDPKLELFDGQQHLIASNDNWDPALASTFDAVSAFPLPAGSRDACLLLTLDPGTYSAQVSGVGATNNTGVGLVEVYDVGGAGRLVNLSARVGVDSGAGRGIAGFVIPPGDDHKVLVRAAGPGLTQIGLSGCLADPKLTLLDSKAQPLASVLGNAATTTARDAARQAGAFPLSSDDCVLIATLSPGTYTAQVTSASGRSTGVALVEVYDISDLTSVPADYSTPPAAAAVDFGPNVVVFDPSMSAATIQATVDRVFAQQEGNQFGNERYAFLFKPGAYATTLKVGYYTQVLGLGSQPDDVLINGTVQADARYFNGNATQNFWRGAENIAVAPTGGTEQWAVSQACPFRRMHVKGNLRLDDNGWSSGGFISDTQVDGRIYSGSQQQWLTRNSDLGGWNGSNWNMVFVGVNGAPPESFPTPPYVTVDQAPVTREKPFLRVDANGYYSVFVPALQKNSRGATWTAAPSPGYGIPIDQFYIAQAATDTATTLNAALAAGKHLLLTPGIYHLDGTLQVNNPNTVVLGLGLATLYAENGVVPMRVADVDGVKIAGVLFDAGPTNSPVLLEVGEPGSHADHSANPTSLHDLFFRVGGAAVGKADVSLRINSNNVIGDDLWIWRADHSYGVGWTLNTTTNGLIVNGANVTMYALAVEHYHQYQTVWNGDGGRTYFYQSECPYDVPTQADWTHDGGNGYASYKVADNVTSHEAWGLGIYCFFNTNKSVRLDHAIEAPSAPGVRFHDMTTVSLGGGAGEITHVVNNSGAAANGAHIVSTLQNFP